ncbi:hypothetical protein OG241_23620 [Streptomyces sp. NBC_01390]|uniref:hypothetical protein n=1 Tax=Streptomyces sp. NBC_01390 TaxID=2903850 RepID=UPI003243B2AE
MAETQSNAPSHATTGTPGASRPPAPPSGVIHVRTRLAGGFTVIANALAQQRGSAVTIGVAAYILSVPDGARISIAALCAHFDEGEILISRALRELEAAGYLERRRVRGADGRVRTQTFFYDVPRAASGRPTLPPPQPTGPRKPEPVENDQRAAAPGTEAAAPVTPVTPLPPVSPETATPVPLPPVATAPPPPLGLAEADPQAVVILASLRIVDRRLILSRSEVAELAPAVAEWLGQGLRPEEITGALTNDLPDHFRARPARVLAFRLREAPLPTPTRPLTPDTAPPVTLPWQTCDGCERAFRTMGHSRCRECRGASMERAAA